MTIIVCYLLASLGVNGVMNPYYYVNSGNKEELKVIAEEEYQVIDLSNIENGYLNIEISEINTFQITADVVFNCESSASVKEKLALHEGINSFKISDWGAVENLAISQEDLSDGEVEITNVFRSSQKQVDTLKMLEILISFLLIVMFYDFMTWIKNKYTR